MKPGKPVRSKPKRPPHADAAKPSDRITAPRSRPPVVIDVLGTPAPKGSGRAIMVAGHAVMVPSGSDANKRALAAWDTAVRAGVAATGIGTVAFALTPIEVTIIFRFARPTGHYNRSGGLAADAREMPIVAPDVDKCVRATLDSLNGTLIDDDARVVQVVALKEYASAGQEGARIVVGRWQP